MPDWVDECRQYSFAELKLSTRKSNTVYKSQILARADVKLLRWGTEIENNSQKASQWLVRNCTRLPIAMYSIGLLTRIRLGDAHSEGSSGGRFP